MGKRKNSFGYFSLHLFFSLFSALKAVFDKEDVLPKLFLESQKSTFFLPPFFFFFSFFSSIDKVMLWNYCKTFLRVSTAIVERRSGGNGRTLLVIFLFIFFFSLFSALKADFDKEDVLRKLFWKARAKARVVLKEQLAEFRDKRAAGLGSIFGPPDQELKQCIDNRTKELQVIDELLLPLLESTS